VFAWLATLKVCGWVRVVKTLGIGKYVLANTTEEVGQRGDVFVAVIAVGSTGCMGAYLVKPVCNV
jgi:hypothetical protein